MSKEPFLIFPISYPPKLPEFIDEKISVVIPNRNGGPKFRELLEALRCQRQVREVEIIVVDSESTDDSLAAATTNGAKIISISQAKFNHGATRNLGASHASGEYLVFMVNDALPVDFLFLYRLTLPFVLYPELAALSGRQRVRPLADLYSLYTSYNLDKLIGFHQDTIYQRVDELPGPRWTDYPSETKRRMSFFDDVCSAVRRRIFTDMEFAPLSNAEDIDFGLRMLERKLPLGYLYSTGVYHWHERRADYALRRAYINTKANVHVIKNQLLYFHRQNNIDWPRLQSDLWLILQATKAAVALMGDLPLSPMEAVKNFIGSFKETISLSPSEVFTFALGLADDDARGISPLLAQLGIIDINPPLAPLNKNIMLSIFMERLQDFSWYVCHQHKTLHGRQTQFVDCLYKILGTIAGEALGSFYLEQETSGKIDDELLRLEKLMGYGVTYF